MSKLHQKLHKIDVEIAVLASEREEVCGKIHEETVEAARLEALEYKTTIQNGDYGSFNGNLVFFADHRGEIIMVGYKGTHPEVNMNNQKTESLFTKQGNIFEELEEVRDEN